MFSQEGRSKEYQSRGAQGQRGWEQLPEDIHLPDPERRPTDAATRAGRAHPGHTASLQLSGTGTEAEFVQPWLQEASCALLPQQVLRIHVMKGSCRTISGPAPDISWKQAPTWDIQEHSFVAAVALCGLPPHRLARARSLRTGRATHWFSAGPGELSCAG